MLLTVALVVVFCLGLFHTNPLVFWNDDYQISILPVLADVARSWREGHWPLLSPYSWACGNLAGEYQYGTFSVFVNAVVVAVWQWPLSFGAQAAAMSITHLTVLAAGAFLLARQRRLSPALAVMVGLVSALNGWEIGWGATNWFGALAAHAWLPWAWWAFEMAMAPAPAPTTRWMRLRPLLPAPFVYLILTGGFPYSVVMLMVVSAWLAARTLAERRGRALGPLVLGWVLGLGLSAPAWLSLLEAMRGSSRAEGVGPGNHAWTVPLSALPGFVLPNWSTLWPNFSGIPGLHAALELSGALLPMAGLCAGVFCLRGRILRVCGWDLLLLAGVLVLCLLPSPGVFRWSFRWLPLLHIVLALVGAQTWQTVVGATPAGEAGRWFSWSVLQTSGGFWTTALVGLTWLLMTIFGTANPDSVTRWLPALTFACAAVWLGLDLVLPGSAGWRHWAWPTFALAFLWVTYGHLPTNCGVPRYAFDASLAQPAPLSRERLYLSLYPPPEKKDLLGVGSPARAALLRPGSTNLFAGLRFINGYTPIMGAGIGRTLHMDTHGEVPPEMANQALQPGTDLARLLQAAGVDGLIVAANYPLAARTPGAEWTLAFSSPDGTVFHRVGGPTSPVSARSPARANSTPFETFENLRRLLNDPRTDDAVPAFLPVLENTRQRVVVDLSKLDPGSPDRDVDFHRPYHPGYEATVDGISVAVETSSGGSMPTVRLPPGPHRRLVLSYRPRAVVWGGALAACAFLAMIGVGTWLARSPGPAAV